MCQILVLVFFIATMHRVNSVTRHTYVLGVYVTLSDAVREVNREVRRRIGKYDYSIVCAKIGEEPRYVAGRVSEEEDTLKKVSIQIGEPYERE